MATGSAGTTPGGRLAILLPITSRGRQDPINNIVSELAQLRSGLDPPGHSRLSCSASSTAAGDPPYRRDDPWITADRVCIRIGIDEDDEALRAIVPQLVSVFEGLDVRVRWFSVHELRSRPKGPVCWMWDELAQEAVSHQGATHFVLLGDDVQMEPTGWPQIVLRAFAADGTRGPSPSQPATTCFEQEGGGDGGGGACIPRESRWLRCLLLLDAADPGYPSFPVITADHLAVFGSLFPDGLFVNQMGDPFLCELYRRLGAVRLEARVTVRNTTGGIQLPDDRVYVPPRYPRTYPPLERVLQALDSWTARGSAACGRDPVTTVDVLVPCGRANAGDVRRIVETTCCARTGTTSADEPRDVAVQYDVRVGVVVDAADPAALSQAACAAIKAVRDDHMGKVRLRFNGSNQGASRTSNRLMDESLAQLLVLLDDDVEPTPGLASAYVAAAAANPHARGFVGPTFLPDHGSVWAHAVHMSDVAFFWTAPANRLIRPREDGNVYLPWAVTANLAVRNTHHRFDPRFPRTGGGEDIDFCLRACPDWLLAVPRAACRHPLWNDGWPDILRFARWAVGDGQLLEMYGRLTYRSAPNAAETLLLLLAVTAALLVALALTAVAATAGAVLAAAGDKDIVRAALQRQLLHSPGPSNATTCSSGGMTAGLHAVIPAAAAVARTAGQAAGAVARAAAAAAAAVVVSEFVLEMVRHCANRARLARHPCPTWWLRLRAAAVAAAIRNVSEAGRLYGHITRSFAPPPGVIVGVVGGAGGSVTRVLRLFGKRFDWFCGLDGAIVRMEQLRAAARAAVHGATAAWAAAMAVAVGGSASAGAACAHHRCLAAVMAAVWAAAVMIVTWGE